MIEPVGRVAACVAVTLSLGACMAGSAPGGGAAPQGWSMRGERTYSCARPACPSLRLAGHDEVSLGPAGKELFEANDGATRRAFETAIDRTAATGRFARNGGYRINGPVRRSMIGAHEVLSFAMVGANEDGAPADPGHAIIVPKNGRFHMVFAFADTTSAARAATLDLVNALSL